MKGGVNMVDGHSRTRLYNIWSNMKQRCFNPKNPKYTSYGGRGITVCDEWKNSFQAFAEWALSNGYDEPPMDVPRQWVAEHGLTIDRVDSEKGYSPDNCRWITFQENRENRKGGYHYSNQSVNELLKWTKDKSFDAASNIPTMYKWERSNHKANTIRTFAAFLVCRKMGVRKMTMLNESDIPKAKAFLENVFSFVTGTFENPA